jgi:signal transduction histidine kinase/ligand-binding sensor domain-containing protein
VEIRTAGSVLDGGVMSRHSLFRVFLFTRLISTSPHDRKHRWARLACITALLLVVAGHGVSYGGEGTLPEYMVTSWSDRDGLTTASIGALGQTPDGYLLLGGNAGLVRFDGTRFRLWNEAAGRGQLPEGQVLTMLVARDGTLWIGSSGERAVSRIKGSAVRTFTEDDGLDTATVVHLQQDRAGLIWASARAGLYYCDGDRWHRIPQEEGLPQGVVHSSFEDHEGALWVATASGLFRRTKGSRQFELIERGAGFNVRFSEDEFGRLWRTDSEAGIHLVRTSDERAPSIDSVLISGAEFLRDHTGRLLLATLGHGLWNVSVSRERVRLQPVRTSAPVGTNLRAMYEDREGNLWVGGFSGLQQLTPRRLKAYQDVGSVRAVQATSDGTMWLGTSTGVIRLHQGVQNYLSQKDGLPGSYVNAMHVDGKGALWVATNEGLAFLEGDKFRAISYEKNSTLSHVYDVTSDNDGGVWVCNQGQGVYRWTRQQLLRVGANTVLDSCVGVFPSFDRSSVWVTTQGPTIARAFPDGHFSTVRIMKDSSPGPTAATIFESSEGALLIGGNTGIATLTPNGQVTSRLLPRVSIRAILQKPGDGLWLGTTLGVIHIPLGTITPSFNFSSQQSFRVFDDSDGLAGIAMAGGPSAIVAPDKSLWFVTAQGVTQVPAGVDDELRRPLPVYVQEVFADATRVSTRSGLVLPPRTRTLQIGYSALSFSSPSKTRFFFMLEGFDHDWVDAGGIREAVYNNLAPGPYRFRVRAIDARGTENEAGALEFTLSPTFYQTSWFYVIISASAALMIAALWRHRVNRLRREFAIVLSERVRMSREIHDTILQSLIGVSLRLDVLTDAVGDPGACRRALVSTREQVENYIRDTRQWIWNLRSTKLEAADLGSAIKAVATDAAAKGPVAISVTVSGKIRTLPAAMEQQLLRIAEEAIANAIRHSSCDTIEVTLEYGRIGVRLTVLDDGTGFDVSRARLSATINYGLTTMQERAEQVGGTLEVTSSRSGTAVTAKVPYRPTKRWWFASAREAA